MIEYITVPLIVGGAAIGIWFVIDRLRSRRDDTVVTTPTPPAPTPTIVDHGVLIGPRAYYQLDAVTNDRQYVTTISVDTRDGPAEVLFSWDDDGDEWRIPVSIFLNRFTLNTDPIINLSDYN